MTIDAYKIEQLIDENDLSVLLATISMICEEKADHIKHTWQDTRTAKPWCEMAARLDTIAHAAQEKGL